MSKHMVIFGVTWDVEKCLSAGDPLVGLWVGTLEMGQKWVYHRRKRYHLKSCLMFVSHQTSINGTNERHFYSGESLPEEA